MSQSDRDPKFTSTCFDKYEAATEMDFPSEGPSSCHWDFSCRLPIITSRTAHCVQTGVQPLPPLQSFHPDKSHQLLFVSLLSDWKAQQHHSEHSSHPDKQVNSVLAVFLCSPHNWSSNYRIHYQYERDVCFSIRRPGGGSRLIFPDECFIKDERRLQMEIWWLGGRTHSVGRKQYKGRPWQRPLESAMFIIPHNTKVLGRTNYILMI